MKIPRGFVVQRNLIIILQEERKRKKKGDGGENESLAVPFRPLSLRRKETGELEQGIWTFSLARGIGKKNDPISCARYAAGSSNLSL